MAKGFFLIEKGLVRIYKMDEQAKEIEIGRIGPGGFLGEAIVFAQETYPVYAQAVKNIECLYFEKEQVLAAISKNAEIAKFFIQLLAQKCVILNQRIESLSLKTVKQRLLDFLVAEAQKQNSDMFTLKMKKQELARQLGTISETLSRNFKQLQDEGYIKVSGNSVKILT